jgi:hypothetical protein
MIGIVTPCQSADLFSGRMNAAANTRTSQLLSKFSA